MSRRRGGGRGGRQGWEKLSLAPRAAARSRVVIAFAALTLLTCLLFLPALRPGTAFFFRDVSQNHEPFRRLTTSIIAGGEMPLWNPYRGAGQPLLANPN
ncbi:MAG: hypothetical protein ACE5HU_03295, partial [Acidobacteriota bacterium]